MKNTKIQWCDDTVNPVMGCEGCELWTAKVHKCYAGQLHRLRSSHKGFADRFDQPEMFAGRMAAAARARDLTGQPRDTKPWLDGLPRLIFVSDMGDALSESISFEFLLDEIIDVAESERGMRHQWLWLTKRPGRMAQFGNWLRRKQGREWPSNVWVGTSMTSPASYSRALALLSVGNEEAIRFLSVEPQLTEIDLSDSLASFDWVIQGGESSTRNDARPFDVEWADELRESCREAAVAYFLKQLGSNVCGGGRQLELDDSHGGDWSEWPARLRVREFPIGTPVGV